MLLNNYSVLNSNCGREIGGGGAFNLFTYFKDSTIRNFYTGDHVVAGETDKANFPTGSQPPYSFIMAFNGGEISATTTVNQLSSLISGLTQGINISTNDLNGQGTIVSGLALVVQLACEILGQSSLSADLAGKLEMAASMAGSCNIVSALGLISELTVALSGSNTLSAGAFGIADLSADITSSSTLSPENLAAAVWNSIAASFNTAGTMGNKMNSAASAGDPWGTALPGSYVDGEAGKILSQIQTLVDELHRLQGLDPNNPSTTTPTNWDAGDIHIEISGDGVNETTMTRI